MWPFVCIASFATKADEDVCRSASTSVVQSLASAHFVTSGLEEDFRGMLYRVYHFYIKQRSVFINLWNVKRVASTYMPIALLHRHLSNVLNVVKHSCAH